MRAAVFYATREGQSERVAERVAADLRARLVSTDVVNVRDVKGSIDWPAYDTAFVVASVHVGHHEKEMIEFVRRYRGELTRVNAAFLSLTLSQAGAEDPRATLARRETARGDALRMIYDFANETGWHPRRILPVAGALMYSKYNFLVRLVMKHIARRAGFTGDTSHDYEFTNWPAVDRFVHDNIAA
ncbi:MAG TPA: flavodoxin domain-containing protein [Vicinamibacterales bacterium]|nr:flavodoxin domain-containing protein [Vicinamibacterales bacterium]